MTQFASAWIVTAPQLERFAELVARQHPQDAWDFLFEEVRLVEPFDGYPGYAVAILLSFLNERHLPLPLELDSPAVRTMVESETGFLGCLGPGSARAYAAALDRLRPSGMELARYYEDLAEAPSPEAGEDMQAALGFLLGCVRQPLSPGERLLLIVS